MRRVASILMICLFAAVPLRATTKSGGKGLIYLHSAMTLPRGNFEFFTGTRFFGKIVVSGPYTLWDVQIASSFNIGISKHFELAVSPILYQDTNRGGGFTKESVNFPDDILVSAKVASFGGMESHFYFGGLLQVRIPSARQHNIIYEPYSAGWERGRIGVGVTGLISYFQNAFFPDEGWSIHGNLGYFNHNDVGKQQTPDPADTTASAMSSELLLGVGFNYPFGTFNFSAEMNSRFFLQQPPPTVYSRENMIYLTAGVYYTPYRWVTFEMGIDLLLYSPEDQSDYAGTSLPPPPEDFTNYPVWRGNLGVTFILLPSGIHRPSERDALQRKASEQTEALERLMKDQKDTEDAESELLKLRSERKRVEEELARIRKLLEEEKKKK